MNSSEIIPLISRQRFGTYRKLFNQIVNNPAMSNEHNMVLFYMEIQDIYSQFFMPIQALEITLRNKLHSCQSKHYRSNNWFRKLFDEDICTEKAESAFNTTKRFAVKEFKEKGITTRSPSPEDYVSRLNFGFWVELLSSEYRSTQFWQYYAKEVFPNKNKVKIGTIYDSLSRIHSIRNRLYHYEPLWDTSLNFSNAVEFCTVMEKQYLIIFQILRYCSLDQEELLKDQKLYFEIAIEEFKKKYS